MNNSARYFHLGASSSLVALILLCLAWELMLAPLRPGGSWMVLKVLPLLLPLRGVLKRDVYTLQWSSMLILVYLAEGLVRATSDTARTSVMLALGGSGADHAVLRLRAGLSASVQESRQGNRPPGDPEGFPVSALPRSRRATPGGAFPLRPLP
ncbi:putative membrane protein [Herbaspirillum rubrisubalbicans]|nr:putative membrane protein [Herbaspirillum rubrisubalbicans]